MKQLNGYLIYCEVLCERKRNVDINYRQEETYFVVDFLEKVRLESTIS